MAAVKEDCFAYNANESKTIPCTALTELYCKKEECKFYKSKKQREKELRQSKRSW